jgi:hypothetical protein
MCHNHSTSRILATVTFLQASEVSNKARLWSNHLRHKDHTIFKTLKDIIQLIIASKTPVNMFYWVRYGYAMLSYTRTVPCAMASPTSHLTSLGVRNAAENVPKITKYKIRVPYIGITSIRNFVWIRPPKIVSVQTQLHWVEWALIILHLVRLG